MKNELLKDNKLSEWEKETIEKVYKNILKGKIWAKVESVSKSGMTRQIAFYMVEKGEIMNVSDFINWLTEYKKPGEYSKNRTVKASGCGMDMIFHTLYNALDLKDTRKWKQNYRTL